MICLFKIKSYSKFLFLNLSHFCFTRESNFFSHFILLNTFDIYGVLKYFLKQHKPHYNIIKLNFICDACQVVSLFSMQIFKLFTHSNTITVNWFWYAMTQRHYFRKVFFYRNLYTRIFKCHFCNIGKNTKMCFFLCNQNIFFVHVIWDSLILYEFQYYFTSLKKKICPVKGTYILKYLFNIW